MSKIYEHAQDTMGIVDKLYRKARVRMLISGITVWNNGDKVPTAKNSHELHGNFRKYIQGVRKQLNNFDDAVYFFDGDMFGAGGTATSHFCKQSSWNEIFIIATLSGSSRLKPRDLANTLTHEFAHQLNSYQHTFDPPHTCPTYHLFGGRCTLGGNDWPKGFSSNEITKLRDYSYRCLTKKPQQTNVFRCGNGKIDPGEECDCGTSQNCLQNNPCCDGQMCKLKRNAECSTESCCDQQKCKWNRGKSSTCKGLTNNMSRDYGIISYPSPKNKHNYEHWKITTTSGTKAVLFLTMSLFEFEEGCPFDYIKVYDGPDARSKLLGTFCRTPSQMKVEGSTNNLFVTYKSDGSHESHFKLTYSTQSSLKPDGKTKYLIKGTRGQCLNGWISGLTTDTRCDNTYSYTATHHLKHDKTGKCIEPSKYYGRVHPNARLLLESDCTSPTGQFHALGNGRFLHPISSLCLQIGYSVNLVTSCTATNTKVNLEAVSGVIPTGRIYGPRYTIKHFGGKCLAIAKNRNLYLTNACTQKFYLTNDKKLISAQDKFRCIVATSQNDNSRLKYGSCDQGLSSFQYQSDGTFQQVQTGQCIHPLNGYTYPGEGHELVTYRGCSGDKLTFTLEADKTQEYIIKHSAGRCLAINSKNQLYLTSSCSTKFHFTNDGQIKVATSNKCLRNLNSGDNSFIITTPCDVPNPEYSQTLYKHLSSGSIQQKSSGRCMHPLNGSPDPTEGKEMVLYTGCDANRLKFTFEKA